MPLRLGDCDQALILLSVTQRDFIFLWVWWTQNWRKQMSNWGKKIDLQMSLQAPKAFGKIPLNSPENFKKGRNSDRFFCSERMLVKDCSPSWGNPCEILGCLCSGYQFFDGRELCRFHFVWMVSEKVLEES